VPGPEGDQSASTWEWAMGISQYTDNPGAMWLFLQWATCRPMILLNNVQQWEGQPVYGPARSNWLFEQDEYLENGPKESWREAHRQGMEMVPSSPPPVPLHTPQNMDMMTEAAVAMNSAVTDNKSAQQALSDAAPPITEFAQDIPDQYLS
jgi:multiple sugar transport system substrate-binding protein